jgi:hypothetical protein
MRNGWRAGDYHWFRLALGLYLCVHFAQLVPWGSELFSSAGVLPDAATSPLTRAFPNLLAVWDTPAVVTALLALGAVLSVALALGLRDRLAALLLWYLWACLFGRNPLIQNPSLPFVGWLLLAHALVPAAGAWRRGDDAPSWRMPPALFGAAWAVMALAYTYSGACKLGSPSWLDGTALRHVLENPLARPGAVREALLGMPDLLLRLSTWGTLALELCFAPLALARRARPWLWITMTALHLALVVVIDFADLSLGMVMLHLFTLDPAWWREGGAREAGGGVLPPPAGVIVPTAA